MARTQHSTTKADPATAKNKRPAEPELLPAGKMVAARNAVRSFLMKDLQAREVRVTKLLPLEEGGWVAEADILVPDMSVKRLGLKLSQEVLESEFCMLVLDSDLTVLSYEMVAPDEK